MEEMQNNSNEVAESVGAATTENTAGQQSQSAEEPEKKYTDADLDRIISRRLMRERERLTKLFTGEQQESEFERRERDVLKRELAMDARDMLEHDGLPRSVSKLLNYESKEALESSYNTVVSVLNEIRASSERARATGITPRTYANSAPSQEMSIADAFSRGAR